MAAPSRPLPLPTHIPLPRVSPLLVRTPVLGFRATGPVVTSTELMTSAETLSPDQTTFWNSSWTGTLLNPLCCVLCLASQRCWTVCDPVGYSPPGSSVPGILQVRILEWVVIPSSRGSFPHKGLSCLAVAGGLSTTAPPGMPHSVCYTQ